MSFTEPDDMEEFFEKAFKEEAKDYGNSFNVLDREIPSVKGVGDRLIDKLDTLPIKGSKELEINDLSVGGFF